MNHPEHKLQIEVAAVLASRLDPATTWWTSVDAGWMPTAWAARIRRERGVRSGVPDVLALHEGRLIAIELKSPRGRLSDNQRAMREELLRAGARWWLCRSAQAVLEALRRERVPVEHHKDNLPWKFRDANGVPQPADLYAFNPEEPDHLPQSDPSVRRHRRPVPKNGLLYWQRQLGGGAGCGGHHKAAERPTTAVCCACGDAFSPPRLGIIPKYCGTRCRQAAFRQRKRKRLRAA